MADSVILHQARSFRDIVHDIGRWQDRVPDVVNCKLETLLSMKIGAVRAETFAVTIFGPFITIETGLAEPDASPDQFAN